MMRPMVSAIALAVIVAPLAAAPVLVQAPAGACPPGTRLVPAGKDAAGNPIAAYCAADPTGRGAYDPYSGRGAADPQASPSGGPNQQVPTSR